MEIKEAVEIFKTQARKPLSEITCGDFSKYNLAVNTLISAFDSGYTLCKADEAVEKMEKLMQYTEPAYNAKLFCVRGSDRFKEGHIYKIIDGKFDGEGGTYSSLESINHIFFAQFMEVLDD